MITATKICDVLTARLPRGTFAMQSRPYNAIIITKNARATFDFSGKSMLLSPYHVLFVSGGTDYTVCCKESGDVMIVNFEGTVDYSPAFAKKICDTSLIEQTFCKLTHEHSNEYAKAALFYKLCDDILSTPSDKAQERLLSVFDYINEHFCEELSNDVLADMAALSNIHFRRLFKIQYGVSPHEYIMTLRIDKAKALLREGQLSVEEIGASCGFSSLYYFSNSFKKSTGLSPSAYARQNPAI